MYICPLIFVCALELCIRTVHYNCALEQIDDLSDLSDLSDLVFVPNVSYYCIRFNADFWDSLYDIRTTV